MKQVTVQFFNKIYNETVWKSYSFPDYLQSTWSLKYGSDKKGSFVSWLIQPVDISMNRILNFNIMSTFKRITKIYYLLIL